MRLIDADALKEEVKFQQEHMWPEDLSRRIPGMIDNAPTIPAISVEWLEEKLTDHPEISYAVTDGIIAVLMMWQQEQEAR